MALASVAELAKLFRRTERYVQMLVRAGMPKQGHGQYDVGECMLWYIHWLQGKAERPEPVDGQLDPDRERARLLKEQADDAAMSNALRRGELIPLAVYKQEMAYMISTARQNLLNLPGRIAPQLEGENRTVIKYKLRDGLHEALNALATRNDSDAAEYRSGDAGGNPAEGATDTPRPDGDVASPADSPRKRVGRKKHNSR